MMVSSKSASSTAGTLAMGLGFGIGLGVGIGIGLKFLRLRSSSSSSLSKKATVGDADRSGVWDDTLFVDTDTDGFTVRELRLASRSKKMKLRRVRALMCF